MARELAVEAERQGVGRVCLVDLDPMLGLTRWWEARAADTPARVDVSAGTLVNALPLLRQQGFALTIIDTPPAADPVVAEAVRAADLVLVPVRPSPDDLRAIPETIGLVEEIGRPMIFIINAARKRTLLTGEAARRLSQHGTVATPSVHTAEIFPQAAVAGHTAVERDLAGIPAGEIRNLWLYVAGRLARLPGSSLPAPPARQTPRKKAIKVSAQ